MLSFGRNLLDRNCLKNVYYGHIHSHVIYAITALGSMASQLQLKELNKLQKQCIRIVNKTNPTSDIAGQFESLKILKLDELITLNLCKLGHKISHTQLPKLILQVFKQDRGKKQHRYPTRNCNMTNIQKHVIPLFNRSFLIKSLTEFSKLPMQLKLEENHNKFVRLCKQHLTNNFQA